MIKRTVIALKSKNVSSLAIKGFAIFFKRNTIINGFIIYCAIMLLVSFYKYSFNDNMQLVNITVSKSEIFKVTSLEEHKMIVNEYYKMRKYWRTSNLGSFMFKNENNTFLKRNKTFLIYVWKYWRWFQERHIHNGPSIRTIKDVLSDCSVDNCEFTGNESTIDTADVVLIHIIHGLLPPVDKRNPDQLWVFLNDDSPRVALANFNTSTANLNLWHNTFNWSMTYRTNADVPVPCGRTLPFREPLKTLITYEDMAELIPNLQKKRADVLVSILLTTCQVPPRTHFISEFQKFIKLDVYGNCRKEYKQECLIHFKSDCVLIDNYYFVLVIEDAICRQYLTENIFYNAYAKGAIPIIVGTSRQDCKTLLPPNSYIHFSDYHSYKELADKVTSVVQNIQEYLSYHLWRNHFKVTNEHGYFGTKSYHLCRLCEALNYNLQWKKSLSFHDLRLLLDPRKLCVGKESLYMS